MSRYIYIGDPLLLSECKWNNNDEAIDFFCRSGQCAGKINGKCPCCGMFGDEQVLPEYRKYFKDTKE